MNSATKIDLTKVSEPVFREEAEARGYFKPEDFECDEQVELLDAIRYSDWLAVERVLRDILPAALPADFRRLQKIASAS